MQNQLSRDLHFPDNKLAGALYGDLNKNLHIVEESSGVKINVRGNSLNIIGREHEVELAADLLQQLYALIGKGYPIYSSDFGYFAQDPESKVIYRRYPPE